MEQNQRTDFLKVWDKIWDESEICLKKLRCIAHENWLPGTGYMGNVNNPYMYVFKKLTNLN